MCNDSIQDWLTAKVEKIVVFQPVDSFKLATNVELLGNAEQVLDARMGVIVTAKNLLGLLHPRRKKQEQQ